MFAISMISAMPIWQTFIMCQTLDSGLGAKKQKKATPSRGTKSVETYEKEIDTLLDICVR